MMQISSSLARSNLILEVSWIIERKNDEASNLCVIRYSIGMVFSSVTIRWQKFVHQMVHRFPSQSSGPTTPTE